MTSYHDRLRPAGIGLARAASTAPRMEMSRR